MILPQPHVHPYLRPSVHCWSCLSSGRLSRLSFYAFEICHFERTPSEMIQSWFLLRRSSSLQALQFGCLSIRFGSSRQAAMTSQIFVEIHRLKTWCLQGDVRTGSMCHLLHLYQSLVFLKRRRQGCIGVMNGLLINVSNWKVVILLNCFVEKEVWLTCSIVTHDMILFSCCSWRHCFSAVQWQVSSTTTSPLPEFVLRCDRCWGSRRTDQLERLKCVMRIGWLIQHI